MPDMTPDAFRARLAAVLGAEIDTIPNDLAGLWDLIGPVLADRQRTRDRLAVDCDAFGIPTTDADGPLSLHQMTAAVVKRWRSAADDSADLAEVRTRLAAAGYVPTQGEALGDVVASAIGDTREADDKREILEEEVSGLLIQRDEARALASNLAAQLNTAATLIASLTATISRLTR